jgi:hypothetical protein
MGSTLQLALSVRAQELVNDMFDLILVTQTYARSSSKCGGRGKWT